MKKRKGPVGAQLEDIIAVRLTTGWMPDVSPDGQMVGDVPKLAELFLTEDELTLLLTTARPREMVVEDDEDDVFDREVEDEEELSDMAPSVLSDRQAKLAADWKAHLSEKGLLPETIDIGPITDELAAELAEARGLLSDALGMVKDVQAKVPSADNDRAALLALLTYLGKNNGVGLFSHNKPRDTFLPPETDILLLVAIELADAEGTFDGSDDLSRMHHINSKKYQVDNVDFKPPIGPDFDPELDGDIAGNVMSFGDGLISNLQLPANNPVGKKHLFNAMGFKSIWNPNAKNMDWSFWKPVSLFKRTLCNMIRDKVNKGDKSHVKVNRNPKAPVEFKFKLADVVEHAFLMTWPESHKAKSMRGEYRNVVLAELWQLAEGFNTRDQLIAFDNAIKGSPDANVQKVWPSEDLPGLLPGETRTTLSWRQMLHATIIAKHSGVVFTVKAWGEVVDKYRELFGLPVPPPSAPPTASPAALPAAPPCVPSASKALECIKRNTVVTSL